MQRLFLAAMLIAGCDDAPPTCDEVAECVVEVCREVQLQVILCNECSSAYEELFVCWAGKPGVTADSSECLSGDDTVDAPAIDAAKAWLMGENRSYPVTCGG